MLRIELDNTTYNRYNKTKIAQLRMRTLHSHHALMHTKWSVQITNVFHLCKANYGLESEKKRYVKLYVKKRQAFVFLSMSMANVNLITNADSDNI